MRKSSVFVREHHALGNARGAAGIEATGEILAASAGIGHRGVALDQRLAWQPSCGRGVVAQVDARRQAAARRAQIGHHWRAVVVHQQHSCVAVVQRVGDLGRAPARVHRGPLCRRRRRPVCLSASAARLASRISATKRRRLVVLRTDKVGRAIWLTTSTGWRAGGATTNRPMIPRCEWPSVCHRGCYLGRVDVDWPNLLTEEPESKKPAHLTGLSA